MLEYISDVISEGKQAFTECSIIVAGDFNQWDAGTLEEEHPDLKEVNHSSSRGNLTIDRSFVNFHCTIKEAGTLPPLETKDDRLSDHKMAFARAEFQKPQIKNLTYT